MTPQAELTEVLNESPAKRVSVVIVSYNRAKELRKSLTALGDAHQVLVVDNGSWDGTPSMEAEFPHVRFIRLPKNFGYTKALNIGVRAAEGTYILWLHDDAVISGDAVTKLVEILEERTDIGAVCPLLTDEDGRRVPQVRPLPTPSNADPAMQAASGDGEIVTECVSGAAILFRSYFLRALRQVDERYGNYGPEIEMSGQVKKSGKKIVILSGITAQHGQKPSPMRQGPLAGDRAVGTAGFLSKNYGFLSGILYRIKVGLGGIFTFRFGLVAGALGNVKIDGNS